MSAAGSQGGGLFPPCRDGGEGLPTAAQLRDAQSGGRVGKMVPVVSHWAGERSGWHPCWEGEVIPRGTGWSLGPEPGTPPG